MYFKYFTIISGFVIFIFSSCTNPTREQATSQSDGSGTPVIEESYLRKGGEITGTVFKNMSGKLKNAMEVGGVSGAIEYCNLAASPLVDSLSSAHSVSIKRTSSKLRNPENAPSTLEMAVIKEYLNPDPGGELPSPKVVIDQHQIHYYAPIFLMDNCLKCHGGVSQDIADADYTVIKRLYPEDQAVGFKTGELRGIWSLTFPRDK